MTDTIHHALPSGTRLEQYELRSVLGTGGFGITYLGWDTRLDGPVAIKEYLPVECAWRTEGSRVVARTGNDQDNFDFGKQRFLEEARTLNRFSEPNIIRVRTFLEANDTAYMVMDYEEGEPLSALLEREGTLDEATLKNLMIPILDGLRAVHREQFLHRDIKPGNIYLRSEGSPVLLDFGAARQALGEHSRSMTGIVTAGYAPFEQYSSRGKQGPWTDLYAIGATMYRAISGQPPVESSERVAAVGEGDPDPLVPATEIGKGHYSEPLLSSIDWMLNLVSKDRPQSVEAVLERLLGRTGTQPAATPAPPPKTTDTSPPSSAPPPKQKQPNARSRRIGAGVLVLALLGLGSWVHMNGSTRTKPQFSPEPKMVAIPGGSFVMGSSSNEQGREDDERQHSVTVMGFKLAKTEVTQAQWQAVMIENPSYFKACETCPVERVSWFDVQSYIAELNRRTGRRYRLPTEAEWEYACRGGRTDERYCGGDYLDSLAWHLENSDGKTHPVGQKQPNGYGLYDMSGNVWELTCSAYDTGYGGGEQRCMRQNKEANRSIRGGSWTNKPRRVRSAYRNRSGPIGRDSSLGFRLAED
ncbi:MAG: bifunctional serine/threonine-protein kinase/formylglycine-generating enzyme family protein [Candidatus Thiodiazotropha taylori]